VRPIPLALRHRLALSAVFLLFPVGTATSADAQVGPPDVEPLDGTATFTDLTGPGACSFLGEPPDNLHVGLSSFEYGTATDCGGYLDVTGPLGTVRVKITDHCRRCEPGLVDVTRTAFSRIADVGAGRVPVSYRLVRNPPLAESISLRVKDGSSRWWLQVQALDHGNPIARFEALRDDGGWRPLVHTADNYWAAQDPGLGDGPFTFRITDVFGQQVTIDQVALAPGVVQPTAARLYPAAGGSPGEPNAVPPTRHGDTSSPAQASAEPGTGLVPPLSILPPTTTPSRGSTARTSDDADGDDPDGEGAAAPGSRGDDDSHPGTAPIGPLLVLAVATAGFAWWRTRRAGGRTSGLGQAFRPTPQ
jgi:expansin